MRKFSHIGFGMLFAAFLLPDDSLALESCTLGQEVVIPGGYTGTVIEVNGAACTVRPHEAKTGDAVWSAFMLKSPDGIDPNASAPATAVAEGTYECYSTAGYSFVDVVITGPDSYEDRDGNAGTYSIGADGQISYESGTLAGHPSYTKNGKIYLTAPGGDFYMTCDPQ